MDTYGWLSINRPSWFVVVRRRFCVWDKTLLPNPNPWNTKVCKTSIATRALDFVAPPLGQVSSSQSKIQIVKCKIPSKPITMGDEEKNILWIDAEDYCQELINELEKIVEIVCTDLLDLIRSKTFFPM
jgi:hypothetical protein